MLSDSANYSRMVNPFFHTVDKDLGNTKLACWVITSRLIPNPTLLNRLTRGSVTIKETIVYIPIESEDDQSIRNIINRVDRTLASVYGSVFDSVMM